MVAVTARTACPARQDSPKKNPTFQHRDDGFFALLRNHGQLDQARLNIEDSIRRIPLRVHGLVLAECRYSLPFAELREEGFRVELVSCGLCQLSSPGPTGFPTIAIMLPGSQHLIDLSQAALAAPPLFLTTRGARGARRLRSGLLALLLAQCRDRRPGRLNARPGDRLRIEPIEPAAKD